MLMNLQTNLQTETCPNEGWNVSLGGIKCTTCGFLATNVDMVRPHTFEEMQSQPDVFGVADSPMA